MSRSGYVDDYIDDFLEHGRWRGCVASAIRGKRGQALLRDLRDAMDAMPEKRLIAQQLQTPEGCCALGVVGQKRGHDLTHLDPEDDPDRVNKELAKTFDVAECLVQEVEWENDEGWYSETPEQRWTRMRAWVEKHIKEPVTITPRQEGR